MWVPKTFPGAVAAAGPGTAFCEPLAEEVPNTQPVEAPPFLPYFIQPPTDEVRLSYSSVSNDKQYSGLQDLGKPHPFRTIMWKTSKECNFLLDGDIRLFLESLSRYL